MSKRAALALALAAFAAVQAPWAQSATSSSGTATVSAVPEPYTAEEFPEWARALRRFEIVSLGAFPILLFYTRVGYDVSLFVKNDFDTSYAPWPFKNEYSYDLSDDEQIGCVLTAAGLSLVFGAVDAVLLYISDRESR